MGPGSEVGVLYECFVCGRAFAKVQSLRAHLKAHKGHNYVRTTIWADGDLWGRFKAVCEKHHTTTCHLLGVLMQAAVKGEEEGVVNVGAPGPIAVHVNQVFLGAPRSRWKVPLPVPWAGKIPVCESAYRVRSMNGTIDCSRWGRGVSAAECGRCPWLRGWTEVR